MARLAYRSEDEGLTSGRWSSQEDEILKRLVPEHGTQSWSRLAETAKQAGLKRNRKSCRERWVNYLDPQIRRGPFSHEEERLIIQLQIHLGNKWSDIAEILPGRRGNDIKHHFKNHMMKKMQSHCRPEDSIGVDQITEANFSATALVFLPDKDQRSLDQITQGQKGLQIRVAAGTEEGETMVSSIDFEDYQFVWDNSEGIQIAEETETAFELKEDEITALKLKAARLYPRCQIFA